MPSAKPQLVSDEDISGEEKLRKVSELVEDLRIDLEDVHLLPYARNFAIEQLKVFGRNTTNADPIFTPTGIEVLTKFSFHSTSPSTSKTALQCLVNALLSKTATRQMFVNLGYSARAVVRLKNPKGDDELLISRLLFLTSYDTNQDFGELIDNHGLAEYINDNIARHIKSKSFKSSQAAQDDLALVETLKLLFNVAYFYPSKRTQLSKSIGSILKILSHRPIPSPALQQPINHLINGLTYLDLEDRRAYAGLPALRLDVRKAVEQLMALLDAALRTYKATEPAEILLPLIGVLKRLAGAGLSDVRPLLRESMIMRRAPSSAATSSTLSAFSRKDKSKAEAQLPALLQTLLASPIPTALHDALSALVLEVANGMPLPYGWNVSSRLGLPPPTGPRNSFASSAGSARDSAQIRPGIVGRAVSSATDTGGSSGIASRSGSSGMETEAASDRHSSQSEPSLYDSRPPSPVAEIVQCQEDSGGSSPASSVWSPEDGGDFLWVDREDAAERKATGKVQRSLAGLALNTSD